MPRVTQEMSFDPMLHNEGEKFFNAAKILRQEPSGYPVVFLGVVYWQQVKQALSLMEEAVILGLNHITIAVSDLGASLQFYRDVLGFTAHVKWDKGAYLSVGELWFCLSLDEPCPKADYTRVAFDIAAEEFETFSKRVVSLGAQVWKENKSEGKSLYILDPDGHKLEIHAGSLESRLETLRMKPYSGLVWL